MSASGGCCCSLAGCDPADHRVVLAAAACSRSLRWWFSDGLAFMWYEDGHDPVYVHVIFSHKSVMDTCHMKVRNVT